MNHQDNIRIFTEGVEDARQEQQARSQEVGTNVNISLTVDLQRKNIYEVPEEVIETLKEDVERLHLSHNQIYYVPDRFSQCQPLKYLNLRGNLFQDFPKQLFSLPNLEVLDFGHNNIRSLPDEIGRMKSLKYCSLTKNNIKTVPNGVKDLNNLRVLKLAGNPLRSDFARIVEAKDTYTPFDESSGEAEREAIITSNLKQYLKVEAASKEAGEGSSSEGPLETPRPLMRNGSLRFPLKANGNGSESASEARSPGFAKPPIPARSHYRVTSGQNNQMQKPGIRRPGLAPLNVGNERNRSNSESVLQMTQNNRSKRMGMVTKKNNGLKPVEENQHNRNSFHLRGQSHASALREWHGEDEIVKTGPIRIHRRSRRHDPRPIHQAGSLTQHMSELRRDGKYPKKPKFGDTTKSLRYSLCTFEQCTKSMIESLLSRQPRQWARLRDAQHDAEFGLQGLLHSVNHLVRGEKKSIGSARKSRKKDIMLSINACHSAVARYIQLGNLLLDKSTQILAEGGRMYIRTLVLLTLGSSAEACHSFHGYGQRPKRSTITQKWFKRNKPPIQNGHQALQNTSLRDQSLTPTRERPVTAKRIVKNGTTPPQPNIAPGFKPATTTQPAVPLYFNGRSRSNSRADQYPPPSSTDSTFPFSPAMTPAITPLSSGLFSIPGTPLNRSRSSSIAAGAHSGRMTPASSNPYFELDYGSQAQFDKVYNILEPTVIQGRKVLPILKEHFIRSLNEAQTELDRAACEEWSRRVRTCSMASELSDAMLKRLHAVKLQDPTLRNEKSFWDLCKRFLAAIGDLLNDVRAGYREGCLKQDIINMMRPISRSSRDASMEIQESPWNSGGMGITTTSPASINSTVFGHSRQRRSSGSNSYVAATTTTTTASAAAAAAIPSTPLSAALGPAAQATVPSTPANTNGALERSFQGGWSERADALQMMQQTMVHRR
ncbi:MAG: hypothetical protein Q9166_002193 [cf. Caloplaca sp. 2 TL-2023]